MTYRVKMMSIVFQIHDNSSMLLLMLLTRSLLPRNKWNTIQVVLKQKKETGDGLKPMLSYCV